ncbi:hypothetical protein J4772_13845 [Cohnella sp. LGH]|uniref:hypothetical protein n=1 Tax=Cohnella sp. LGH TaxID=1619153 RepID=UPI001ADAB6C1|nr:hypothetical protein [Cohnella sp. LGH]QTH45392.1 hypothetical protein J4772_13845 [Cohnella sp. LGH]
MDYSELMQLVSCGMEYNFYVETEEYWISHNENGYYLTRVRDSHSQEFRTAGDLFENGRINGKSLLELWDDIKEYF